MSAYSTLHWRLRTYRGRACLHQCSSCPAQARDWAQIHTETGEDIWTDYIPLCRRCHIRYDRSGHRTPHTAETKALLSQKNRGYKHMPEAIAKIQAAARHPSPEARAKMAAGGRASGAVRRGKTRQDAAGRIVPAEPTGLPS